MYIYIYIYKYVFRYVYIYVWVDIFLACFWSPTATWSSKIDSIYIQISSLGT